MVLGIRSKNRKSVAVEVDYLIHVVEIKPWPLSQSSKSVHSVLLEWANGDLYGSFSSGVGDGKIEFAESFRLQVNLCKETSKKGTAHDTYQKNTLEFYLYEPKNDKATKVQLLGSAVINLAEYGIIKETITVDVPVNCKKSFKNSGQPVLCVNIQPFDKDSTSSSPKGSSSKEVSLGNGSVSESLIEGNDVEAEIDAFTDDDVSSHSSRTINSSAFETTVGSPSYSVKNGPETVKDGTKTISVEPAIPSRTELASTGSSPPAKPFKRPNESSSPLSQSGVFSSVGNPASDSASFPCIPQESSKPILKKSITHSFQSSSSSLGYQHNHETSSDHKLTERLVKSSAKMPEKPQESIRNNVVGNIADVAASSNVNLHEGTNSNCESSKDCQSTKGDFRKTWRQQKKDHEKATASGFHVGPLGDKSSKEEQEHEQKDHILKAKQYSFDAKIASRYSQQASRKKVSLRSDTCTFSNEDIGAPLSMVKSNLKHEKSMQLHLNSTENSRLLDNTEFIKKSKGVEITEDVLDCVASNTTSVGKETANSSSHGKGELESKIEMLKEELREAAALEVGLYSVVAEHGSSTNKIHAPARRLSRFYFHACKSESKATKANASRAVISGFILVAKACGNDVQRLTFWLSNSIVLRSIVSQTIGKMQRPAGLCVKSDSGGKCSDEEFTLGKNGLPPKDKKNNSEKSSDNWEHPETFMVALEKFEAWIFSRIVESVWWQTITPHMQPAAAKNSSSRKVYGKRYALGDNDQGNFSIDLWKKAFKDACERLCPPRAGGHECGCLPVLSRLVMEQLVGRLDVAMFNAILREHDEEMPTDPVSDPISDSKVLPIPAGKSSFGAGAQLKNAIGSWSRWLTDIFGIDDNDAPEENKTELSDANKLECQTPFKPFRLLNALSDLMMLPYEMLADRSTRKEVCPTFSAPLIKKILYSFVPDEFCPNPIPEAVLDALDSEDNFEDGEESVTSFPCTANPTVYSPPSAASLTGIIGEVGSQSLLRSGSSVLKKSYTSDDELDELDSPITSIITPNSMLKEKYNRQVIRFQLLREVWKDGE
ncbi:hypothetical protein FNV43_RR25807 [Rhamnella rubrinervis]|uniref:C2 NT-type domain-containing protein n=1 Tax=Rhamnella rubrinervis TaxID=2594499 RepID=A0A8K0DTU5_9ROSA|nr:hypothetical protein FNV43_RR25807 [Rhamnella rubrinervis]